LQGKVPSDLALGTDKVPVCITICTSRPTQCIYWLYLRLPVIH